MPRKEEGKVYVSQLVDADVFKAIKIFAIQNNHKVPEEFNEALKFYVREKINKEKP